MNLEQPLVRSGGKEILDWIGGGGGAKRFSLKGLVRLVYSCPISPFVLRCVPADGPLACHLPISVWHQDLPFSSATARHMIHVSWQALCALAPWQTALWKLVVDRYGAMPVSVMIPPGTCLVFSTSAE